MFFLAQFWLLFLYDNEPNEHNLFIVLRVDEIKWDLHKSTLARANSKLKDGEMREKESERVGRIGFTTFGRPFTS